MMKSPSHRLPIAALMAAAVTFVLFLLMQQLVTTDSGFLGELEPIQGIRFGPVDIPDDIVTRSRRKPEKPPPPDDPPPPPRLSLSRVEQPDPQMPRVDIPVLDIPLTGGSGLYLGNFQQLDANAEGDVSPVVVIRPMYPREAALSGIEGWVKVEFTITETGTVKNPHVVDAEPARIFNREALRAILKWKFKPRVIDGVAVERQATQTIDFTLQEPAAR
jgi:protein TonB